jgi:hypothetical protein
MEEAMGTPGNIKDINHPSFPILLKKAWHAQATYLVDYGDLIEWHATFTIRNNEMAKYGKFLPDEYEASLVDSRVQLTFFFVEHLASDLGTYLHAGILVRAIPREVFCSSPGYFIGLEVVDTPYTWFAGYKIWGYRKVLGRIERRKTPGRIDFTVYLPNRQLDPSHYEADFPFKKKRIPFKPNEAKKAVFTLHVERPDAPVQPYARDVYSHTLRAAKYPKIPDLNETRFRRISFDERVEPRSANVRLTFHDGRRDHLYGNWLAGLAPYLNQEASLDPGTQWGPEVRWAPHMSGGWFAPETLGEPGFPGQTVPGSGFPIR